MSISLTLIPSGEPVKPNVHKQYANPNEEHKQEC